MATGLSLTNLRAAAAFLRRLPAQLRHPLSSADAIAAIGRRLSRRSQALLDLLDRAVFTNPRSPYAQLLALAGCERGDLHVLVAREGIEGALAILARKGVYLTIDEFKGRQPVKRGSTEIQVTPGMLQRAASGASLPSTTGGSSGAPSLVGYSLAAIRDRAVNEQLALDSQGGGGWVKSIWGASAGSAPVVIRFSLFGSPVARWFVQVSPNAAGIHRSYRWVAPTLRMAASMAGVAFPRPEQVTTDNPLPIALWMSDVLRSGRTPHLYGFVSPVVRLCQAAREAGIELRGARFTVTGEPATDARLSRVRAVGAEVVTDYGSVDAGGPLSHSCLRPEASDDVHFYEDLHAVIQAGEGNSLGLPPNAMLLTTLCETSPIFLLNVSMGDQAMAARRECGCPLGKLGLNLHLHTIRSFEKLTAGGMTFLDTDVIRILEEELPWRFGGGMADYQLIEEEGEAGDAEIILAVHPQIGPVDEQSVRQAFLDAIGRGAGAERIMAYQWSQAGFPRIERRIPSLSMKGKILHVWRTHATPAPRNFHGDAQ